MRRQTYDPARHIAAAGEGSLSNRMYTEQSQNPRPRGTAPPHRALFVLLILTAIAWSTREIPRFGFLPLVDDDVNIFFNPHLGAPDASRLAWMASDFSYVHRYMPLGWLGFSLVYTVSGLDPAGYHVAGIGLHALNAILVFIVLEQVLRRFAGGSPERDRIVSAGLATLLWALHPLRVETTAWCSGLLYAQAGFFALVCLCARMAELRARDEGRLRRAALCFGIVWASFVASVLTYPVALFLPLCFPIVDRVWLAGKEGALRSARRGAAFLALMAVGALMLTLHARGTVASSWGRVPSLGEFSVLSRILQASYVAMVYVLRTLWPADLHGVPLTLFDPDAPGGLGWIAAAGLVCVSWAAWRLRRRAPFLAVCWLCYLVLLTPNLGLTEHPHTIADRYLYFTSIPFSVALAIGIVRLRTDGMRAAARLACGLAAVACAAASLAQARTWRDIETFQRHLMQVPDPDLNHITAARTGKLRFLEGDVRGGREAVKLELDRAPGVGGVILTWRQVAPAGPLSPEVASRELQEWPTAPYSFAEVQIARDQLAEGRTHDALLHLDSALARSPDYVEARFRRGVLLALLGRPEEALHDWLIVERSGGARHLAPPAVVDFMTERIAGEFDADGNARASRLMREERQRQASEGSEQRGGR
jgi:protein O-mannosyl-transferase